MRFALHSIFPYILNSILAFSELGFYSKPCRHIVIVNNARDDSKRLHSNFTLMSLTGSPFRPGNPVGPSLPGIPSSPGRPGNPLWPGRPLSPFRPGATKMSPGSPTAPGAPLNPGFPWAPCRQVKKEKREKKVHCCSWSIFFSVKLWKKNQPKLILSLVSQIIFCSQVVQVVQVVQEYPFVLYRLLHQEVLKWKWTLCIFNLLNTHLNG